MNCETVWCYNLVNPFSKRSGRAKHVYICSDKCSYRKYHYKIFDNHIWKRKQLGNRTCEMNNCNGVVYWYEQYTTKFCNDCKYLTPRERKSKTIKTNIVKHGSTFNCKVCDKEFIVYANCQYYCSKKCFYKNKAEKRKIVIDQSRIDKGYLYFYLAENDLFYKYGVTRVPITRFQQHKEQGIYKVFMIQGKYWEIQKFETLLKAFTHENNLRFTGKYNFKNAGRTETICKSKMDNPKAKWVMQLIKSKNK